MAFGNIDLRDNVQTFKSSPKFENVDMVILNIDESAYISSPYVKIEDEAWEESSLGRSNGKFIFTYDPDSKSWKRGNSTVDLEAYGITVAYNVASSDAKAGDTITVNRMGESRSDDNPSPEVQLSIELTRSGKTIEANCPLCKPSERQRIADNLLEGLSGYGYQPFQATGAELNPLAELGDAITVNGVYAGLYQQDLTFDQLMVSDIGAPYEEEMENEYSYEDSHERTYRRKFADIAADFAIHWDEITARVTREGTGDGFSWSLIETGFSVKAGDKVIFKVDKNGTYTDGSGTFSGDIVGGSINIGNGNFHVDSSGNLTAKSGTFEGTVYAGQISYGSLAGYLSGSGLTSSSVGTTRLTEGINTSLGYADYSNGVFRGANTPNTMNAYNITAHTSFASPGNTYIDGYAVTRKNKRVALPDGSEATIYYYAWA